MFGKISDQHKQKEKSDDDNKTSDVNKQGGQPVGTSVTRASDVLSPLLPNLEVAEAEKNCDSAYCCLDLKTSAFMTCFQPAPAIETNDDDIRVIEVLFNAWEYSGCDYLWAGIVTNLAARVEQTFGKWKVRLCRLIFKLEGDVTGDLTNLPHSNSCVFANLRCKMYMLLVTIAALLLIFVTCLVFVSEKHREDINQSALAVSITGAVASFTALVTGATKKMTHDQRF